MGTPGYRSALNPLERQGSAIFHGTGRCSQCHESDAQIVDAPRNIGLEANNLADEGAGDGRFKVPSLRNVAVREGYMHDGRFATLEEVIDFYSTDIQNNPDLGISLKVGALPIRFNFTDVEKSALIAFLRTLTDETFLGSDLFSDPFVELLGDLMAAAWSTVQTWSFGKRLPRKATISWSGRGISGARGSTWPQARASVPFPNPRQQFWQQQLRFSHSAGDGENELNTPLLG